MNKIENGSTPDENLRSRYLADEQAAEQNSPGIRPSVDGDRDPCLEKYGPTDEGWFSCLDDPVHRQRAKILNEVCFDEIHDVPSVRNQDSVLL